MVSAAQTKYLGDGVLIYFVNRNCLAAEHLRRSLAHAGAAEIFDKLHNGKFSPKRAITLIMTVLRVRELSELCNGLNATFAALEQRQLANDEVSPEALKRRSAKTNHLLRDTL